MTAIATLDRRPYFERALSYGLKEGLLDRARLEAMRKEGAKGIVQLAGYFGTANLRPELEAARTRLVTLVSLALEADSGGKLSAAAALLKEKTLLALSKSGADRLRGLLKLPTDDFLLPAEAVADDEKRYLSRQTFDEPVSVARYLAERNSREKNQRLHELAYWLAGRFDIKPSEVQSWMVSCESLSNSLMLALYAEKEPKGFFSMDRFSKLHAAALKKRKPAFALLDDWLEDIPPRLRPQLEQARDHFLEKVLPVLKSTPAEEIVRDPDRYSGLFFFNISDTDEITHYDQAMAAQWKQITGGKGDHTDVQCTVLLMTATGLPPAGTLRKKDALELWQTFRNSGFNEAAVSEFIDKVVPFEYQSDTRRLWNEDLAPEARLHLDSPDETRVLAYLHDTCRPAWQKKKA